MRNIKLIPNLDQTQKDILLNFSNRQFENSGIKLDVLSVNETHLRVRAEHAHCKKQLYTQHDLVERAKSVFSKVTSMPLHIVALTLRFSFGDITLGYVRQKMKEHKLKPAEIGKALNIEKAEAEGMLKGEMIPDEYKPALYFYLKCWDAQVDYSQRLLTTVKMLVSS